MQHLLGAFPHSGLLRGSATLDQNEDSPLVGTWRVVFLGEIEPRAARPGMLPRRVRRVGPRIVPAVKSPRWPPLSHGGAHPTKGGGLQSEPKSGWGIPCFYVERLP
jgi:hypothetical protein